MLQCATSQNKKFKDWSNFLVTKFHIFLTNGHDRGIDGPTDLVFWVLVQLFYIDCLCFTL